MAKSKSIYVCTQCGATSPKWMGQCNSCEAWNTFIEEVVVRETTQETKSKSWRADTSSGPQPIPLTDINAEQSYRLPTGDSELDRVLGGGLVSGSVILLGGQPGIGKSTLLLQTALQLPARVLYVSGEESEAQIKLRADRLSEARNGITNKELLLLTETNTNRLLRQVQQVAPQLLVIDSIQTLASPHLDSMPGSVSQLRECAGELQRFAKATGIPVLLIGHITKEGSIAGPKLLEHVVDTVLQFEGDRHHTYRILRTLKNRFGSTDELGIYEMQSGGLREVSNPSELLLSQTEEELSGTAVAATLEGMRPILIESQALVSKAVYGTPQRSATGFDLRRLSMLLAVLEKRGGFPFGQRDVFLNIAGGIRVDDPAIDLAIVAALLSSLEDVAVDRDVCLAGEVGLNGEIRAVNRIEQRIQEAERLGFKRMIISKYNTKGLDLSRYDVAIQPLGRLEELYQQLFI